MKCFSKPISELAEPGVNIQPRCSVLLLKFPVPWSIYILTVPFPRATASRPRCIGIGLGRGRRESEMSDTTRAFSDEKDNVTMGTMALSVAPRRLFKQTSDTPRSPSRSPRLLLAFAA
ncbi:Hypothetical protein NTJ_02497 [Nesidiocoris tenuis]|uniref:Uncharacterized protein n=1 Tax=Nesidiocoris tenuis TaxID=355587 RepID=A0ABN7AE99_9HEMI|nr:Hypothetical protein NTJ_02497 [Nesidiocoris tenuis]